MQSKLFVHGPRLGTTGCMAKICWSMSTPSRRNGRLFGPATKTVLDFYKEQLQPFHRTILVSSLIIHGWGELRTILRIARRLRSDLGPIFSTSSGVSELVVVGRQFLELPVFVFTRLIPQKNSSCVQYHKQDTETEESDSKRTFEKGQDAQTLRPLSFQHSLHGDCRIRGR